MSVGRNRGEWSYIRVRGVCTHVWVREEVCVLCPECGHVVIWMGCVVGRGRCPLVWEMP